MESSPSIHVVIPTLGRPSLERALTSVRAQSFEPTGVVIVTNGPEPLSPERIAALQASGDGLPVVVTSLPPFSGPAICRNVGAWMNDADYVAFLDDDDEFDLDYLARMAARISFDEPDLLYGVRRWERPDGSVRRETCINNYAEDEWMPMLFCHENPGFGGQNLVVNRDVLFRLRGFPVDLLTGQDRGLAMAALDAGCSTVSVDEAVVRCHDPEGYRAGSDPSKWVVNLTLEAAPVGRSRWVG